MNKKRIVGFVLSLCMALSIIQVYPVKVEAATSSNGFGYTVSRGSNETALPRDAISFIKETERDGNPGMIYAKWPSPYQNMLNTKYQLTYHIQDDITYYLTVERADSKDVPAGDAWENDANLANTIKVTLRIKESASTYKDFSKNKLWMYDPALGDLDLSSFSVTGSRRFYLKENDPTTAVFLMKDLSGFSITDSSNNRNSFYWNGGTAAGGAGDFYVVVSSNSTYGLDTDGKIFDFTLERYINQGAVLSYSETLYVCTGYGDAVNAVPIAKEDVDEKTNSDYNTVFPGLHLNTKKYPDSPEPGTETGVRIEVNYPMFWSDTDNKFVQLSSLQNTNQSFLMKLDLTDTPLRSISIPNIFDYNADGSYNSVDTGAKKETIDGKDSVVFTFTNLEEGIVFDAAVLHVGFSEGNKALLVSTDYSLESKDIYTYPKYRITADGTDDFYMEIVPLKNATGRPIIGTYMVYEINTPTEPNNDGGGRYTGKNFPYSGYRLESRFFNSTIDGKNILIKLNKNARPVNSEPCWYYITFDTLSSPTKYFNSQFYYYQADQKAVRLGTPEIAEPIVSKVVSALGDNNELLMTLKWKIGRKEVLENTFENLGVDYVDYVFGKGYKVNEATNSEPSNFTPFAVIRLERIINKDGEYDYTISIPDLPDGPEDCNDKVLLIDDGKKTVESKQDGVTENIFYTYFGRAVLKMPIYSIDSKDIPSNAFIFPDTFLIEAYATYELNDRIEKTNESVRKIITVNALDSIEVPTPQSFKVTPNSVTRSDFQLTWLPINTTNYEQVQITPKQRVLLNPKQREELNKEADKYTDSVTYNMYISTNKDYMTTLANFFRSDTLMKTSAFYGDKSELEKPLSDFLPNIVTADNLIVGNTPIPSETVLDFANSELETSTPVKVSGKSGRDYLREGKIVKISNIGQSDTEIAIGLTGLDENQPYYIMVETQASPYIQQYLPKTLNGIPVAQFDEAGLPIILPDADEVGTDYKDTLISELKTGFSKFSVLVTVTTTPDSESPQPDEIPPPAPTGLDKKDVTGNMATIFWDKRSDLSTKDYAGLKYQILRIRGDQLTNTLANLNIPADKFIKELDKKLEPFIWQTKGESNELTFDGSRFKLYDGGNTPSYDYLTTDKFHEFTDRSLKPNQLYMYYVRAVTLKENKDKPGEFTDDIYSHSVWVPISVTTDPVHPPLNLKVEQEKVKEPKTSTVISFDAPITKDKLGSYNYFGLSITEEGVELPERLINSTADINALYESATASDIEGYTNFQYTVNGLKPGKSYIIKLRMYDIDLADWSPYSNIARTRTEVDDDDYDFNTDLDKWTLHYLSQIEALLTKPLWQMSDTTSSTSNFMAEVRNSVFDTELQRSTDGTVLLGQKGNASQTYYIPLTAIKKANDAQKGFLISFGDQEIVIQKSTFDTATTKEIQNAMKSTENADIFVKIDASVSRYNSPVNGTTPASPSITVAYSVIGTRTTEKQWDKDNATQLKGFVNNPSMMSVFSSLLGQKLNAKASDEELVKFVDEQVNNVAQTLITMTRNSFNSIINSTYAITVTDKPFIVKSNVDGESFIGGYYNELGTWTKQEQVSQYGNKSGIVSRYAGMYIFAGDKVTTPVISGLQNIAELSGLYAKYGLNDYFGADSDKINSDNATVGTVTGVTARIMGAAKTDDPISYLKSKGYQISSANKNANIQMQQAIYLLMALYEQKTNTKVDTLKINNYNATANITGIDPKYNRSILAAIELGLVDSEVLQPRQALLTSDYIKMLSKLAKKVKL